MPYRWSTPGWPNSRPGTGRPQDEFHILLTRNSLCWHPTHRAWSGWACTSPRHTLPYITIIRGPWSPRHPMKYAPAHSEKTCLRIPFPTWHRIIGLWQEVAMDSLKFHMGSPCPTLLRPAVGPPLKWQHGRFRVQPSAWQVACSCLLSPRTTTPHAYAYLDLNSGFPLINLFSAA
jgi:hypothetical protein